jgi:hypothetical protein
MAEKYRMAILLGELPQAPLIRLGLARTCHGMRYLPSRGIVAIKGVAKRKDANSAKPSSRQSEGGATDQTRRCEKMAP